MRPPHHLREDPLHYPLDPGDESSAREFPPPDPDPRLIPREFVDEAGVRWVVRETHLPAGPLRRRRTRGPAYAREWLTFISRRGEFRIAPYPPDWRALDDHALERWCRKATWEASGREPSA